MYCVPYSIIGRICDILYRGRVTTLICITDLDLDYLVEVYDLHAIGLYLGTWHDLVQNLAHGTRT